MAKLWLWISGLFPSSKIGIIFSLIFSRASSVIVADIMNPTNQKIAYEFVKELHENKTMTASEKAWAFNQSMMKWAAKEGIKMSESVINCLRELALNAIKSQSK